MSKEDYLRWEGELPRVDEEYDRKRTALAEEFNVDVGDADVYCDEDYNNFTVAPPDAPAEFRNASDTLWDEHVRVTALKRFAVDVWATREDLDRLILRFFRAENRACLESLVYNMAVRATSFGVANAPHLPPRESLTPERAWVYLQMVWESARDQILRAERAAVAATNGPCGASAEDFTTDIVTLNQAAALVKRTKRAGAAVTQLIQ